MARRILLILFFLLPLAACERAADTGPQTVTPVAIEAHDECAVCGMSIHDHPGPKGQLYMVGSERPAKFCSTVDFFIYSLQPEHENRITHAYVHDMAGSDWKQPDDAAFTPARDAWYVVGHDQTGAMGPTLASFRDRDAAQDFADRHGGRILPYSDVTLDVLQELSQAGFLDSSDHGGHRHHH